MIYETLVNSTQQQFDKLHLIEHSMQIPWGQEKKQSILLLCPENIKAGNHSGRSEHIPEKKYSIHKN